jgi:hypothetical protein
MTDNSEEILIEADEAEESSDLSSEITEQEVLTKAGDLSRQGQESGICRSRFTPRSYHRLDGIKS